MQNCYLEDEIEAGIDEAGRGCLSGRVYTAAVILPEEFPMIDRVKSEVQDPRHLIPEDSMQSWVRGGLPSRQISRNVDYIQRCENLRNNSEPKSVHIKDKSEVTENRLIYFDAYQYHASSNPINHSRRIVINLLMEL